jgi:two-component system sensor histidine kinase AgrC
MFILEEYLKLLISIIFIYIVINNLVCNKFKVKEAIIPIFLSEILGILILMLNLSQFVELIPVVVVFCVFVFLIHKKIVISIIITLLSLIILVLTDNLIGYLLILIYKTSSDHISNNNLLYSQYVILMLIVTFLISKLIGTLINKKLIISNIKYYKKSATLIVVSVILTFAIFYVNIILQANNVSDTELAGINAVSFAAYFILLMVIMYILIKSISKDLEIRNKQLQFENLQEYTSNLEALYADMRAFRHDYINIISSLIGYIENKDMKGLEEHFNENILPISKSIESNNFKLGLLKNLKLPEVKGIVSSKVIRAQELGIDVFIDIVEPIEKINMYIIDLCRVIGILIDNAVEAALKCTSPQLKIAFINKKDSVLILVVNNYSEVIPPINKLFQKGFSTKGNNRGIGLSNLKEIINNYNNVSLDTVIEDENFIQNIEISNK